MKHNRWVAFTAALILGIIAVTGSAIAGTATQEPLRAGEREMEADGQELDIAGKPEAEGKDNFGYHSLSDFTAETLDGGTFTPEDLKAYDLTIVYFWSATCGYCVEELPALAELMKELPTNVQLITWCPDGGVYHDTVVKMLDRRGLDAVTIVGGEEDIDLLIRQLLYTPMALFLDKEGNMLREPLIGAPDDPIAVYNEIIEEILEQLGVEREEPETEKPEE